MKVTSLAMPQCAEPTPQGEQLLDPFHLCGRVKRLRDKPMQSFAGSDTFLRIAQAEKEGLIEVRIDVSPPYLLFSKLFFDWLVRHLPVKCPSQPVALDLCGSPV